MTDLPRQPRAARFPAEAKRNTLLLATLLLALPLFASIFMRIRSSAADLLKATGGRIVYDAKASVNGEDATITVLGFDGPLHETASSIRSLWRLPPLETGTAPDIDGAWITRTEGTTRRTLLLFPGGSADRCSAWLVETGAKAGGPIPPPPGGNPLPSADLKSWIENLGSRMVLTVHETTADPASCLSEISGRLVSDGWLPLVEGPSSALFANDGKAAVAAAFPSGRTAVTRAIVLRQR